MKIKVLIILIREKIYTELEKKCTLPYLYTFDSSEDK